MLKIENYTSPKADSSVLYNVPMKFRNDPVVRMLTSSRVGGRVRYRGPRRSTRAGQRECLRQDATTFSVYVRS